MSILSCNLNLLDLITGSPSVNSDYDGQRNFMFNGDLSLSLNTVEGNLYAKTGSSVYHVKVYIYVGSGTKLFC